MPFLSLPCHNDEHFLRRKGAHRAERLRGGGESLQEGKRSTEIPAAPCQLAERPLNAARAWRWGRQGSGTRTAALGHLPEEQVLEGSGELQAPPQIRPGFGALGGTAAPHRGFGSWPRSGRCRRSGSAPEHPTGSSQGGAGGTSGALSIPQQHPGALRASFGGFLAFFLSERACPALQLSHPLCRHVQKSSVSQFLCQKGRISIPWAVPSPRG